MTEFLNILPCMNHFKIHSCDLKPYRILPYRLCYVSVLSGINLSIWKQYGLTQEPLKLSGKEKADLTRRYIEQGVFNEVLTPREMINYQD